MKPEISCAGLPQADPFVLAVIATDLHSETVGTFDFQRGWPLHPLLTALFATIRGGEQFIEFETQRLQSRQTLVHRFPIGSFKVIDEGSALINEVKALLVIGLPFFEDHDRPSQFSGLAIKRLRFIDLLSGWCGEAQDGICLFLQSIRTGGAVQAPILVVEHRLLFALPAVQALANVVDLLREPTLVQPL